MTSFPIGSETDPVRRAIIAAMNRLFAGTPQRSNGRLNVTQLAIEADLKRWHLTHQHPDLKDRFQEQAAKDEAKRSAHVQSADAFEDLKKKYTELQATAGSWKHGSRPSRPPPTCSRWRTPPFPAETLRRPRSASSLADASTCHDAEGRNLHDAARYNWGSCPQTTGRTR